jgi:hypothetical protein
LPGDAEAYHVPSPVKLGDDSAKTFNNINPPRDQWLTSPIQRQ